MHHTGDENELELDEINHREFARAHLQRTLF